MSHQLSPACGAAPLIRASAEDFDRRVMDVFASLAGGCVPEALRKELTLPVRNEFGPTFGVGLTSAAVTSSSAFLGAVNLARPLLQDLIPAPSQLSLLEEPAVTAAYDDWCSRVDEDDQITLEAALDDADAKLQQKLTRLVYKKMANDLSLGTPRQCALRASLALEGAKAFLNCPPSPGLQTYIDNHSFRVWLQFYIGEPLWNPGRSCPRPKCSVRDIDAHGDHLLHCNHGFSLGNAPLLRRHDGVSASLRHVLRRAGRNPMREKRAALSHSKRPDIRARGERGGVDYLDLVVTHPLASARSCADTASKPDTLLVSAANKKKKKYTNFLAEEAESDATIVPVAISTLGGWHAESRDYFRRAVESIAARSRMPRRFAFQFTFARIAACLVRHNVACLTEGEISMV